MDVCSCGRIISTPDTLQHSFYYNSRVNISVCVFVCAVFACLFFENATLNLFGQSETVWNIKDFWFLRTDHPWFYFAIIHFVCPCLDYPPICFRGSIPLSEVVQSEPVSLSICLATTLCLTLPPPGCLRHCSGFILEKTWLSKCRHFFVFFPFLLICTSIVEMGESGSFNIFLSHL